MKKPASSIVCWRSVMSVIAVTYRTNTHHEPTDRPTDRSDEPTKPNATRPATTGARRKGLFGSSRRTRRRRKRRREIAFTGRGTRPRVPDGSHAPRRKRERYIYRARAGRERERERERYISRDAALETTPRLRTKRIVSQRAGNIAEKIERAITPARNARRVANEPPHLERHVDVLGRRAPGAVRREERAHAWVVVARQAV